MNQHGLQVSIRLFTLNDTTLIIYALLPKLDIIIIVVIISEQTSKVYTVLDLRNIVTNTCNVSNAYQKNSNGFNSISGSK